MATGKPSNMQGDLFSRGFPKYNESYYFFSISKDQATEFTKKLAVLVKNKEISTLEKVLADWDLVEAHKPAIYPVSNALIAFSMAGLERASLPNNKLQLDIIEESDRAFAGGMKNDGPNLNDPEPKDWDPLFQSASIHGLLKVAGSSADQVKTKLDRIKGLLGHPTVIADIEAQSLPAGVNSRLDGQVRPKKFKGKEHFGFEDGISQPLLEGIDKPDVIARNSSMTTPQSVITVGKERLPAGLTGGQLPRPEWMLDGSFLVFRKFEQDVGKFQKLTGEFKSAGCISADQFGARLMGRWQSGASYVDSPGHDPGYDPKNGHGSNEFTFAAPKGCALAAHIRKTNPRIVTEVSSFRRIIRNGIPYGTDYAGDKNGKRGLLFVCYQSSIENGFRQIQANWVNNVDFPNDDDDNVAGHDPFIGQPGKDEQLQTTIFDENNKAITPKFGVIPKLITLKGGEYFFVPSISALLGELGSA